MKRDDCQQRHRGAVYSELCAVCKDDDTGESDSRRAGWHEARPAPHLVFDA